MQMLMRMRRKDILSTKMKKKSIKIKNESKMIHCQTNMDLQSSQIVKFRYRCYEQRIYHYYKASKFPTFHIVYSKIGKKIWYQFTFREISSSQQNFFRMLDQKIEDVGVLFCCWFYCNAMHWQVTEFETATYSIVITLNTDASASTVARAPVKYTGTCEVILDVWYLATFQCIVSMSIKISIFLISLSFLVSYFNKKK